MVIKARVFLSSCCVHWNESRLGKTQSLLSRADALILEKKINVHNIANLNLRNITHVISMG